MARHLTPIQLTLFVVFLATLIDVLGVAVTLPVNVPYVRYLQLVTVEGPSTPSDRGTDDCPKCATDCVVPPFVPDANSNVTEADDVCLALPTNDACTALLEKADSRSGYPTVLYNAGSFLGQLWMPWFSDNYGRRKAIIVSIFGSLSGFLLQGFAVNFVMLCIARFWGGLFGATGAVANSIIVDLFPPKERARMFATLTATILLAFMFGPLVGAALVPLGLRVPYYCAAALSLIAIFLAIVYVKEPSELLKKDDDLLEVKDDDAEVKVAAVVDDKIHFDIRLVLIAAQTMLSTMTFLGLNVLLPVVLVQDALDLGITASSCPREVNASVGLWFSLCAVVLILIQVPVLLVLFPKFVGRFGLLPTGAFGALVLAIGVVPLPYWPKIWFFFISMVVSALGNGLQQSIASTYLSGFATKGNAARMLSIGSFADAIGNIIGPNFVNLLPLGQAIPFFVCGACGATSSVMCIILWALGAKAKQVEASTGNIAPGELSDAEKDELRKTNVASLVEFLQAELERKNMLLGLGYSQKFSGDVMECIKNAITRDLPNIPKDDAAGATDAWIRFAHDSGRDDLLENYDIEPTRIQGLLGGVTV